MNPSALELLFRENTIHLTTNISMSTGKRYFEVICMHKTPPTLGNGKEQQEIKFWATLFSRGRLKIPKCSILLA